MFKKARCWQPTQPRRETRRSRGKAAGALASGAYGGVHERARREERHACASEGDQAARTPLAAFFNTPTVVPSASMEALTLLQQTIAECTKCPRLTIYRKTIAQTKVKRFQDWEYWGRPVPGFGDAQARLFVIGLAPAAHGGNRTGRIFTGDRSGDWLYEALYTFGFANQPTSIHRKDGLRLTDCYIAAAVRCAPPANKPAKEEFEMCRAYLLEELRLLRQVRVIVTLGKIAFDEYLRTCQGMGKSLPSPRPQFRHAAEYTLPWGITLLGSYHPSQQNTFTGTLTRPMFHRVFQIARSRIRP